MTCIRTGAIVFVEPHYCAYRGDVFLVGDAYIFRLTNASATYGEVPGEPHYMVVDYDHWFDEHLAYSTLIATNVMEPIDEL